MRPTTRTLLVAAALLLAGPSLAQAQASPQEVAEAMVTAIHNQDLAALRALVHPQVIDYFEQNMPGRLDRMLGGWVRRKISEGYDVEVRDADEVEEYDRSTKIIRAGRMRLQFSIVEPSHFITITSQRVVNQGGREQTINQQIAEAVARHDGRYYFVVPMPVR